ncbi:MAG: phosphate acyltransferase, partial [Shewanella sp.]
MINLTLALDAMGGDHGPHVTVPAAMQALKFHSTLKIILVGNETEIQKYLPQTPSTYLDRIEII